MGNEQNAAATVIVTGASKGIGRAIAEIFAAEGYTILLCARNEVNLLAAAEDIRKKYNESIIKTFTADLSDKTQVFAFADW